LAFRRRGSRGKNQVELDVVIANWTKTLTVDQIEALMIEQSVPAGRVYRAPEMVADPHFISRGAIVEVETERYGTLKMQGSFPKFSATPSSIRSAAPSVVGQHNIDIYSGLLGMSLTEIEALNAAGAI